MYPQQSGYQTRSAYSVQQASYAARPQVAMAGAGQHQFVPFGGQQTVYGYYPNGQQVFVQPMPQYQAAGSRMPGPYQIQAQTQVAQQQQQPTQVFAYLPQQQPQQQATTNGGVYGNGQQQYQQAMSMGQATQQYAGQPAGAGLAANHYQGGTTAQPPPQPQQQAKRERKPLLIVNPETNQAVNVGGATGGEVTAAPAAAASTIATAAAPRITPEITPQPTPPPPALTNANEIQAQFASQVASRMREPSQSEGRNSQGRQLAAPEVKPDEAGAPTGSSQSSRRSSEEVRKKVEVSITTGKKTIVPVPSEPPAAVTKSGSHEHPKDGKSNGPSGTVVESKGLSADAPSFEMRSPQPSVAAISATSTSVPAKSDNASSPATVAAAASSKPLASDTAAQQSLPDAVPAQAAVASTKPAEVSASAASNATATVEAVKSDAAVVNATATTSYPEGAKKLPAEQPAAADSQNTDAVKEPVSSAAGDTANTTPSTQEDGLVEAEIGGRDEDEVGDEEDAAEDEGQGGDSALSDIFRSKSVELKYQYKPEQWSPIHTEGKKQYDRDFLLQFQAGCVGKPIGLPNIPDITLMSPIDSSPLSPGIDFFTPLFAKSNYQGSRGPGGHRAPHAGGQGPRGSKQKGPPVEPQRQHKVITLEKVDVQLHHTENAWKPNPLKSTSEVSSAAEEEIYGKVRSLLNKLTPQNFKTLMGQFKEFDLTTEIRLNKALDIIFEKAISEPNFSVAYANMCKFMSETKVPLTDKPSELVSFRKLLLNRCQREFEKDKAEETDLERLQKEIDDAQGEEQKAKLKEAKEQAEEKSRRRSLGNIRFIGELFKLKILVEAIMHDCIFKLLKNSDEESLECMCGLLRTIGKDLDNEKAKSRMDSYFTRMEKIIDAKKISMRVRFMLQDIVELRKSGWVPRRADNNPKTIEQIHREAEQEAIKKQAEAQAFVNEQRNKPQQSTPSRGPMGSGRGAQPQLQGVAAEDDWQPAKGGRSSMELQRPIKITKQSVADDSVCLRPGGAGGGSQPKWMQGAMGGGRTSQAQQSPDLDVQNKYQALGEGFTGDIRRGASQGRPSTPQGREDSRNSSSPYSARGGASRGGGPPRGSMERESALAATRNATSSANASAAKAATRIDMAAAEEAQRKAAAAPAPAPGSTAVKILSEDAMRKEAKLILEEYLHNLDMKDAMRCLSELGPADLLNVLVSFVFTDCLERSETARHQGGQMLSSALRSHVIPLPQFVQGLSDALQFWQDMEIDIPKFWLYLAQTVSPSVENGALPLSALFEVCQPLLESGKAAVLIAEILHSATCRLGLIEVRDLWINSGMKWKDLLTPSGGIVSDFLKDHKLEFTELDVPLSPGIKQAPASVGDLKQLFSDTTQENDAIFAWIEVHSTPEERNGSAFVRDLTTALCSAAIKGESSSGGVDGELIRKRTPILQKYLDHKADRELQAIFALQALVHRLDHPQGMLGALFDVLYDGDVISEDAFVQWESSEDPAEQIGRGAAKLSVTRFFAWLKEAEEEPADG